MKKSLYFIFVLLIGLETDAQISDNEKILRDYFEVYNQHDIEQVLELVSNEVRIYSVSSDTVTVDIDGKEKLRNWLSDYFRDLPNVTSEISQLNVVGGRISFKETAYWGKSGEQSSLAVYEMKDGRINRVWYYY
ncbi:MAG: hypothetical protein GVY07_15040 [Bacteroidetes bacterium]|jgi:hypothetical protein|nr:hypothetical protein [Bacteroidota bacterium]